MFQDKHKPHSPERPHFYSLLAASRRGREIYDRQLTSPGVPSASDFAHSIKRRRAEHHGTAEQEREGKSKVVPVVGEERRGGGEDDEREDAGAFVDLGGDPQFTLPRECEHLVYVHADSAAGGQVSLVIIRHAFHAEQAKDTAEPSWHQKQTGPRMAAGAHIAGYAACGDRCCNCETQAGLLFYEF